MRSITTRILCIVVMGVIALPVPALSADGKPAPKWEYRVIPRDKIVELGKNDLAAGLTKLGNEGWELTVVDGAYIFKRPKVQNDKEIADLKLRIRLMERDIEMQKERVAWSERMLKMGYLSGSAVVAEQTRLAQLELLLQLSHQDLDMLVPPPERPERGNFEKAPQPRERNAVK